MQYEDYIIHVGTRVLALDTLQWEVVDMGDVPEFLEEHERCSIVYINEQPGRNGKHMQLSLINNLNYIHRNTLEKWLLV